MQQESRRALTRLIVVAVLTAALSACAHSTTNFLQSPTLPDPDSTNDDSVVRSHPDRIVLAPGETVTLRNTRPDRTDVVCQDTRPLQCDGIGRRRDCYCPRF